MLAVWGEGGTCFGGWLSYYKDEFSMEVMVQSLVMDESLLSRRFVKL